MIKKILSTKELFIKTKELFKRDVIISKVNKNIVTAILSLIVVVFVGAFSLNLLSSNSYIVNADNLSELPVTFVDGDFNITFDIDANNDGIATITETGEQGTHTFEHAGGLANLEYSGDVPYNVTNGVLTIDGSSLPIKSVVFTGNFAVKNFNSMFKDFETLENVDFSGVTSIEEYYYYTDMFTNCNNLKYIKLSDAFNHPGCEFTVNLDMLTLDSKNHKVSYDSGVSIDVYNDKISTTLVRLNDGELFLFDQYLSNYDKYNLDNTLFFLLFTPKGDTFDSKPIYSINPDIVNNELLSKECIDLVSKVINNNTDYYMDHIDIYHIDTMYDTSLFSFTQELANYLNDQIKKNGLYETYDNTFVNSRTLRADIEEFILDNLKPNGEDLELTNETKKGGAIQTVFYYLDELKLKVKDAFAKMFLLSTKEEKATVKMIDCPPVDGPILCSYEPMQGSYVAYYANTFTYLPIEVEFSEEGAKEATIANINTINKYYYENDYYRIIVKTNGTYNIPVFAGNNTIDISNLNSDNNVTFKLPTIVENDIDSNTYSLSSSMIDGYTGLLKRLNPSDLTLINTIQDNLDARANSKESSFINFNVNDFKDDYDLYYVDINKAVADTILGGSFNDTYDSCECDDNLCSIYVPLNIDATCSSSIYPLLVSSSNVDKEIRFKRYLDSDNVADSIYSFFKDNKYRVIELENGTNNLEVGITIKTSELEEIRNEEGAHRYFVFGVPEHFKNEYDYVQNIDNSYISDDAFEAISDLNVGGYSTLCKDDECKDAIKVGEDDNYTYWELKYETDEDGDYLKDPEGVYQEYDLAIFPTADTDFSIYYYTSSDMSDTLIYCINSDHWDDLYFNIKDDIKVNSYEEIDNWHEIPITTGYNLATWTESPNLTLDDILYLKVPKKGKTKLTKANNEFDVVLTKIGNISFLANSGDNITKNPIVVTVNELNISDDESNINKNKISASVKPQSYQGSEITPDINDISISYSNNYGTVINLKPGYDFVIKSIKDATHNNIDIGKNGAVTVQGIGNTTGERTIYFDITGVVLNEDNTDITLNFETKEYTGKAITLDASDITVKCNGEELTYGRDFILTNYKNNTDVANLGMPYAQFTVKGVGNYSGSIYRTFTIYRKELKFDTDFKFYRSDGTEITPENPLVKERDGSDSLPDDILVYYENPYNHEKIVLPFDSCCYSTSEVNNSSNIVVELNSVHYKSFIIDNINNYYVTGDAISGLNLGKIVDTIYPTFKNLTSSKATYGKGDPIYLSLVMSEDINCDSDVKIKLYSDDTYIGDATFNGIVGNRITFKYDSDSIINDIITIDNFVLDRTSGDITDKAGNKLDSSITTLQGSSFKIDTTGFLVTIETNEEDGTSKTDIPFKITFGETISTPDADDVLDKLDIVTNAKNSDVYENVKDIAGAIEFTHVTDDSDYYELIIHADKITKDTDTEGRYIKISIDKDKLTADNGTEKNVEEFKVLYINRVIPMDFMAYLYEDDDYDDKIIKTFKSADKMLPVYNGLNFKFKPNFGQGTITAYKNTEDDEEHFTTVNNDENDGDFTYTFTGSPENSPTNFYDVYLKKDGFLNSPKVDFSFKWKNAQDVCDEFEESLKILPKNSIYYESISSFNIMMNTIPSFNTILDVLRNPNNIKIISDSDLNVYLDEVNWIRNDSYSMYAIEKWIYYLQDDDCEKITGDNVKKFLVQCMNELDAIAEFVTFLNDYCYKNEVGVYSRITDKKTEFGRILYEKLSPLCKEMISSVPFIKMSLDILLENYENVIKDDSTRLDLNNDGKFEVFGVDSYLDKEEDEHSSLKVSKITDSDTLKNIDKKVKDICPQGESMIVPFDIKIVSSKNTNKNLEVKDSDKPILVKMELPKKYLNSLIDIYHIKDDGNAEKITLFDKRLENNKCTILFETSDFSPYVLYGDVPSVMISESGDMEGNSITPLLTKFTDNEDVTYEVTLAPNCKATLYAINSNGQKVLDNTIIAKKGESIFKLVKEKIASSYNDNSSITLYVKYEKVEEDNDPTNKGDIKPTTQTIISVQYLDHNSYMNGYSDNTFKPNDNITRAEIATILSRLSDTYSDMKNYSSYNASYSDITGDKWFNNYVGYITAKGIMNGYDGNFYPNKNMTRAEFSAAVVRYLNLISENANLNVSFTDVKGKWYEGDVMKLASLGYINGYSDNTFKGDKPLTRAEACKILNLALNRNIKNKENVTDNYKLEVTRKFTDVSESAWYYLDVLEATISHTSKEH